MRAISLLGIVLCLQACASKPVIDDSKEDIAIKQFIHTEELRKQSKKRADLYLIFPANSSYKLLSWWYLSEKFGIISNHRGPVSISPKVLIEVSEGCTSLMEAENVFLIQKFLLTLGSTEISPEKHFKKRCPVRRAYWISDSQRKKLIRLGRNDILDTTKQSQDQ